MMSTYERKENREQSKLLPILKQINYLLENDWTGQVRINIHKGNISRKIEIKESLTV